MSVLLRVARNVRDLPGATAFYEALGFAVAGGVRRNDALAACLNIARIDCQYLTIGTQVLELTQCYPAGADYPADTLGNDLCFQHIALLTDDIEAAAARAVRAGATAISKGGPQRLPAESGGVIAFKFRDPDGHPLEYLQRGAPGDGYDHSAICSSDIDRSVAFYGALGFAVAARQVNRGPAQARLDGVREPIVDVVALSGGGAPHLELLHYQNPVSRGRNWDFHDIAADRLVVRSAGNGMEVQRDPDGHVVLLDEKMMG
jgi:catechol 2,3-dioxygenase-like lactoylglutathione lyase family enzyme